MLFKVNIIGHKYIGMWLIMKKLKIKLQFKKKFLPNMLMARLLNLKNKLFKLKNFKMVILKKNKLKLFNKMA
jgi:hypothetical protein